MNTPDATGTKDSGQSPQEEPFQVIQLVGDPSVGVCTDGYCAVPDTADSPDEDATGTPDRISE